MKKASNGESGEGPTNISRIDRIIEKPRTRLQTYHDPADGLTPKGMVISGKEKMPKADRPYGQIAHGDGPMERIDPIHGFAVVQRDGIPKNPGKGQGMGKSE